MTWGSETDPQPDKPRRSRLLGQQVLNICTQLQEGRLNLLRSIAVSYASQVIRLQRVQNS